MQINLNFLKRANKKYVNARFSLALIEANPSSTLLKGYWNSFYCNYILRSDDAQKTSGTYCKNRWCIVCGSIRTAHLINGYVQQLQALNDAQFVTLTLPTVSESDLASRIDDMEKEWRKIAKLAVTLKRENFKGVRKMECTIRPDGKYHYHFHLIIEGKENTEWLIAQWLKRFPAADAQAQHYRNADKGSYIELFKYFTKLVTKVGNKDRALSNFQRLDVIFRTLVGKRTYQPFGGLKKISEDIEEDLKSTTISDSFQGKIWRWVKNDWVSEYGEMLTGYEPSEQVLNLVRYCPDELGQTKI